jgi:hypothetical protein
MVKLYDIAIAPRGKLYVTNNDPVNGDLLELQLDADGAVSSTKHGFMASLKGKFHPKGVTVDPSGEHIYVSAFEKELTSSESRDKSGRVEKSSSRPKASVLHITKIEEGKYQVDHLGKNIGSPEGLAVDSTNTFLYVANTWPDSIVRITLAPPYEQKTIATFHQPHGVTIDSRDKFLYVANTNGAIVRVSLPDGPACTIHTEGASFDYPYFLAITADDSRLYTTNAGVMTAARFITSTQLTFTTAPTASPTVFHTPSPTKPPTPLLTTGPPTPPPTAPTLAPTAIPTKDVPDLTQAPTSTPAPTFKPRWVDVDALHPLPAKTTSDAISNARIPQALELQGKKGPALTPAAAPEAIARTKGVATPTEDQSLAAQAAAAGLPLSVYKATAARAKAAALAQAAAQDAQSVPQGDEAAAAAMGLPLSVYEATKKRAKAKAAAAAMGLPFSVYEATAKRAKAKAAAAAMGLPLSVFEATAKRARAKAFAAERVGVGGGVTESARHKPPQKLQPHKLQPKKLQPQKLSSMDEVLAAGTADGSGGSGKSESSTGAVAVAGASDEASCSSGHSGSEGCSLQLGGSSPGGTPGSLGNGWVELQSFVDLKTVVREYMTVECWFMISTTFDINDEASHGTQAKEAAGKGVSGGGKSRFSFLSATQVDQGGFKRGWSIGIGSKPLSMDGGSAFQERPTAHKLLATTVAFDLCTEQRPMHSLNVEPAGQGGTSIGGNHQGDLGLQRGRWYHAAGVYDGKMMSVYVDGEKRGQWPMRGAILYNKRAPFLIGATIGPYGVVSSFDGRIDEMRLWNIPRTAAQVRGSFEGTVPPSALGLLAYWRFDHPNGTFACSETGHFWGW